jgi:hypothetical protein
MDQISEIAKQGLLGVLLFLALGTIIFLYKSREKLQSSRMDDWKEITKTVEANSLVMREWVVANEGRTRALEATARAQELSALSHTNLAHEVERLRDVLFQRGIKP